MKSFILCGGSPPLQSELIQDLLTKVDRNPKVVILTLFREGWEAYVQKKYSQPFKKEGIERFHTILGDKVDEETIINQVNQADILIIGGGDTVLYQKVYCRNRIKEAILERDEKGTPIIGFSAGAIIMGEKIAISPKDNIQGISLYKNGLGIYDSFLIGVHYSKWNDEVHLKEAKKKTGYEKVYGIDDDGYLIFNEETGIQFLGGIHEIKEEQK